MIKLANWLFFMGDVLKALSVPLGKLVPTYKKLIQANNNDNFIEDLKNLQENAK